MAETGWTIPRREEELRASATTELPTLELAEDVTQLMAEQIEETTIDASEGNCDATALRTHALWFMAIIAFRALRAAIVALSSGYEDQAVGYQRLNDELHNRAQKVRADRSGEYARRWLEGHGLGKGAKLAGQDFWELLSGPVHANARAVLDWLAISQKDGSTEVVVGPERRPEIANAALTFMASEGRDICSMLANESGKPRDLASLDARLREAHEIWIPDDGDGSAT